MSAATSTPTPAPGATPRWGRGPVWSRVSEMNFCAPPFSGELCKHPVASVFLVDLTRVKSTRACFPAPRSRAVRSGLTICHWQIVRAALTPWQARYRARPGRRGRIYRRRRKRIPPCLRAFALRQSAPANVPRTFAFGSSGSARNQGPSPRLTAGGPCVFRPCPRSGPTAKMRSACPPARPYPGSSCWIWPAPNRVSPFRPGAGAFSPARPGAAGVTGVRSPRAPRLRALRPGGPSPPCPAAWRLRAIGPCDPPPKGRVPGPLAAPMS